MLNWNVELGDLLSQSYLALPVKDIKQCNRLIKKNGWYVSKRQKFRVSSELGLKIKTGKLIKAFGGSHGNRLTSFSFNYIVI